MCCLGFYARACNISKQIINNIGHPFEAQIRLNTKNYRWNTFLGDDVDDSKYAEKLMQINDDPLTNDKFKENKIKEIFNRYNIKVKFVNE